LFRILQESLTNVLRHARASAVRVTLACRSHHFTMEIADNGVGFAAEDREKRQSFGLQGMEERLRALSGNLSIDSAPGAGTTVTVSVPVNAVDTPVE
jgi:signal transduction histidine kinase